MELANLIGWVGNLFFFMGSMLLSHKKRTGWVCEFLGNFCYVLQGVMLKTNSLWAISIFLCLVNCYGIYQWRKKELI